MLCEGELNLQLPVLCTNSLSDSFQKWVFTFLNSCETINSEQVLNGLFIYEKRLYRDYLK